MAPREVLPPRYDEVVLIARGAMGDVYRARDRELRRPVAVKLLAERFLGDAQLRGRFLREGTAAARLSGHPHIATIYDVGTFNGRPFIVMEYLGGGMVADRLRMGLASRAAALDWLGQAADALDAAHRLGIVHRDLKPANMVFDASGQVHVSDFGIARVLDDASAEPTLTGIVLGTAGYLSPEQARGERATPASDLYSLAVVAYELLTGVRPFARDSEAAEALAHMHDPPPPPSRHGQRLGPAVDGVFERALAKDPARRQASARRFVDELAFALRRDAYPRPGEAPVTTSRRRRLPLLALALLALLVAAGAGVAAAVFAAGRGGDHSATGPRTVVRTRVVTSRGTTTVRTVTTTTTTPPPTTGAVTVASTTTPTTVPPAPAGPHAENDEGYALMQRGDYTAALPLLQSAVAGLRGTGPADPYEGYANYNLGYTLLELGRCREALPPLEQAAALEDRSEVTAAIARARRCAGG